MFSLSSFSNKLLKLHESLNILHKQSKLHLCLKSAVHMYYANVELNSSGSSSKFSMQSHLDLQITYKCSSFELIIMIKCMQHILKLL